MLEMECEMPPQAGSGPHGLNKGFDGHAIHQLCPAAPTDAALHRQRGYKIDALARRQPGAADQVVGFHPGSARHRARNSPGRAKTDFTAQKRADHQLNAQKHARCRASRRGGCGGGVDVSVAYRGDAWCIDAFLAVQDPRPLRGCSCWRIRAELLQDSLRGNARSVIPRMPSPFRWRSLDSGLGLAAVDLGFDRQGWITDFAYVDLLGAAFVELPQ